MVWIRHNGMWRRRALWDGPWLRSLARTSPSDFLLPTTISRLLSPCFCFRFLVLLLLGCPTLLAQLQFLLPTEVAVSALLAVLAALLLPKPGAWLALAAGVKRGANGRKAIFTAVLLTFIRNCADRWLHSILRSLSLALQLVRRRYFQLMRSLAAAVFRHRSRTYAMCSAPM